MSRENQALLEVAEAKTLQHIFAHALAPSRLVLKGGLAMRLLYGSSRATQDIDLNADPSLSGLALGKTMDRAIHRSLMDLKASGLILEGHYTRPKNTDTTSRWKIECKMARGQSLHFKVEVSRRAMDRDVQPVQKTTRPVSFGRIQIPAILVSTYGPQTLAASKTAALLSDNRTKVRDLFDLHILIRAEVSPGPALQEWLQSKTQEGYTVDDLITRLYGKIEAMDYAMAESELLPYLDPGVAQHLDRSTWEDIRISVGQEVEYWLKCGFVEGSNDGEDAGCHP